MKAKRAVVVGIVSAVMVLGFSGQAFAAAQQIQASGTATTAAPPVVTPISSNGQVAVFDISATTTFTGTFTGTSTAQDRCVEQLSTGEATCTGRELFSGTVAGISHPGTVVFNDTFKLNLNTFTTQGQSEIVGGTLNVQGVVTFSGSAVGALPYQGKLVLT